MTEKDLAAFLQLRVEDFAAPDTIPINNLNRCWLALSRNVKVSVLSDRQLIPAIAETIKVISRSVDESSCHQ